LRPISDHLNLGLVEVARVLKPHGYKGEIFAGGDCGKDSALGYCSHIWLGNSENSVRQFELLEAAWMPRGWKVRIAGIDSEEAAREIKDARIFVRREDLRSTEDGEYYLSDLVGADVLDDKTGLKVGTFETSETVAVGQDVWWIQIEDQTLAVPANRNFIKSVDVARRQIRMDRLSELL